MSPLPAQQPEKPHNLPVLPDFMAMALDGEGKGHLIDETQWLQKIDDPGTSGFTWTHLHRDAVETRERLTRCALDRTVIDALVAEDTRPRCTVHREGVVIILRGVNLNPGAEPEDMVSVRFWVEDHHVIGIWLRPLTATADMVDAIGRDQAPTNPGDFIGRFARRLADRAEPVVASLNERIDTLEEQVLDQASAQTRSDLSDIRRTAITLRRFMFPQRDALAVFETEDLDWLGSSERVRTREAAERVLRLAEELDAIRDRAAVVHDQISDQRAEALNRNMLILAVVAAVFLPLGLITGLLGINVGGIPGSENPYAFAIVCATLLMIAAVQIVVFIKLKLL